MLNRNQFATVWNTNSELNLTDRMLDLLHVVIDACNEKEGIVEGCSAQWTPFTIVPAAPLLSFESNTTHSNVTLLRDSYQLSSLVSSVLVSLQFVLSDQVETSSELIPDLNPTATVSGLKSCTAYAVLSQTNVTYTNGVSQLSSISSQTMIQNGQFPISNVRMTVVSPQPSTNTFLVTWLPVNHTLEVSIVNRVELQYSTPYLQQPFMISVIDTITNCTIFNVTRDTNYKIQIRACNDLCCGPWSTEINGFIPNDDLSTLIIAIVIPIVLVLLLTLVFLVGVVIVVAVVVAIVKKQKKKPTAPKYTVDELEML